MLEKVIEKKVTAYAVSLGWDSYKFVSPNNRGVCDRIYLMQGRTIFVEFKAEGKKPTKLQHRHHQKLRAQGFTVYVIDNVDEGRRIFEYETSVHKS